MIAAVRDQAYRKQTRGREQGRETGEGEASEHGDCVRLADEERKRNGRKGAIERNFCFSDSFLPFPSPRSLIANTEEDGSMIRALCDKGGGRERVLPGASVDTARRRRYRDGRKGSTALLVDAARHRLLPLYIIRAGIKRKEEEEKTARRINNAYGVWLGHIGLEGREGKEEMRVHSPLILCFWLRSDSLPPSLSMMGHFLSPLMKTGRRDRKANKLSFLPSLKSREYGQAK